MDDDVLGAVLGGLGSRNLTQLILFAGIEPSVMKHVMEKAIIENDDNSYRQLTPIERTQVNLVYNAVRCRFRQELVDLLASPPPPPLLVGVRGLARAWWPAVAVNRGGLTPC